MTIFDEESGRLVVDYKVLHGRDLADAAVVGKKSKSIDGNYYGLESFSRKI